MSSSHHKKGQVQSVPARTSVYAGSALKGRSPFSVNEKSEIVFDYNIFVTTWQDQIKMRHYQQCEKYCRDNISQLQAAERNPYASRKSSYSVSTQSSFSKSKRASGTPASRSYAVSTTASPPNTSLSNKSSFSSPTGPTSLSAAGAAGATGATGATEAAVGRDPDGLKKFNELSAMHREYRSKVHFSLAYLLKKYMKNYKEAKIEYELSIETDPENPGSHFNLANMLAEPMYKDYDSAKYHFEKAIELEPMYATYRMFYAEFLWHDLNSHNESEKQYIALLKFTNDNVDIYFNYGLLCRDHLNKLQVAVEQFEKALELQPNDAEAEDELEYTKSLLKEANQQNDMDGKEESNTGDVSDTEAGANKTHEKKSSELSPTSIKQHFHQKRVSSFRKSQQDIVLPEMADTQKLEAKYQEILGQRNSLKQQLLAKTNELEDVNTKLDKIESLLKQNTMKSCLAQGPNYVAANAKQVFQILKQLESIVNEPIPSQVSK